MTLVGTSMGAAVIWSYLELFSDARIARACFVDQAPLQVRDIKIHRLLHLPVAPVTHTAPAQMA